MFSGSTAVENAPPNESLQLRLEAFFVVSASVKRQSEDGTGLEQQQRPRPAETSAKSNAAGWPYFLRHKTRQTLSFRREDLSRSFFRYSVRYSAE